MYSLSVVDTGRGPGLKYPNTGIYHLVDVGVAVAIPARQGLATDRADALNDHAATLCLRDSSSDSSSAEIS